MTVRAFLPHPLPLPKAKGLSLQHRLFVSEYLANGFNATKAAVSAGYKARNADVVGPRLLRSVGIAKAVQARMDARIEKAELTADRVLEELRRLAFSDPRGFYHVDGRPKAMHELTAEQASCIASVEVILKNVEAGDGHIDRLHKLKTWDKPKALEMLAKYFKLLTDVSEVRGRLSVTAVDEMTDEAIVDRLRGLLGKVAPAQIAGAQG